MTKVINLYGGPGTGKSTTAAHLFALLKQEGMNAELVTEYAKDKVWEDSISVLGNQVYILGKQYHRMFRLLNKTDVIITDSPLLLSLYYGRHSGVNFEGLVLDLYRSMENVNVFLRRVKPYSAKGRMQDEGGAREIDVAIHQILEQNGIGFATVDGDMLAAQRIREIIDGVQAQ